MRVRIQGLQNGCILSTDVFSSTNRLIIRKRTILTDELIQVLNAFLIDEVEVENRLVNGNPFQLNEKEEKNKVPIEKEINKKKPSYFELFLSMVHDYKNEFYLWQSGLPIDIAKIRKIVLPLINQIEGNTTEIFSLYHLSSKDEYIFQHPLAVCVISGYIAKKLGFSHGEIVQIAIAGCLIDCGMSKFNISTIQKQTALTKEEYLDIKGHPLYSYDMVQNLPLLTEYSKQAILQHHERLDGSGYPRGEKLDKIHPYAKIIAVADLFHAMTSERAYRRKQSPFKVVEMLQSDFFGKYDIASIHALSSGIINFSIGSKIKLSNGIVAEILFFDSSSPTRPLVKVEANNEIIDLKKHKRLMIEEILQEYKIT